jgi:1-acyl-sn-glycerol-3-phosphate acyltransferase
MFDHKGVRAFLRWFSKGYLRLLGWKVEGTVPRDPKFVMIAAPHTSNWDFPFTMFLALALDTKVFWMGKESLFRKPFGGIMRWLGGIPVDRSKANNAVSQMVKLYDSHDELIVIIPPEGTRGHVTYWKTGFYHMAHGANVPIVLGYVDYGRKAGGVGPTIYPTGDLEADMHVIQSFYATVTAKYPEKSSVARVDPSRTRKAA